MGIFKGKDLKLFELADLIRHFGKSGHYFYNLARAIDERPVEPFRVRKSIGAEKTFAFDLKNADEVETELTRICHILHERIKKSHKTGKTITVKIKYADFTQITRSKTMESYTHSLHIIENLAKELLFSGDLLHKDIRLLGVSLSNFDDEQDSGQLMIPFKDHHG